VAFSAIVFFRRYAMKSMRQSLGPERLTATLEARITAEKKALKDRLKDFGLTGRELMKLSDNQSQHSSRTSYPPKRFRPKTGVSRGRISECWRIAISSSSASPPSIHSARRRRAFSGIVRPASSTTKTARRRSVLGETPLSWQGNSFSSSRAASGMRADHTCR